MLEREGIEVSLVENILEQDKTIENKELDFLKSRKAVVTDVSMASSEDEKDTAEKQINKKELSKRSTSKFTLNIIVCVLSPILIFFVLSFTTIVPSESMAPAIVPGDHLLVTRAFIKGSYEYGDVIVFWSEELQRLLVKRVIGTSGDLVELKTGMLFINGKERLEGYVKFNDYFTGAWLVPAGYYFLLGDNRGSSLDARYWANPFISENAVKGRARIITSPLFRIGYIQ